MPTHFDGKHPLGVQPLVTRREKIKIRIQATPATQDPLAFLMTQDEIEMRPSLVAVMKPFSVRVPLGRRACLGVTDVVADGRDLAVKSFLEQPDRSEAWMIAEALNRQIHARHRQEPLLKDFPNFFFLGSYAAVFTWQEKRKLYTGEDAVRADVLYPESSRIIHPIPDLV
jgi:hypothetical protein